MDLKILDKTLSRRQFCRLCFSAGLGLAISPFILDLLRNNSQAQEGGLGFVNKKEAMFYRKIDEKTVQCNLCPRNCVLSDGMKGFCRARAPQDGVHYSLVYANPTAVHVDPIEKKPLFHFLPATTAFSIATAGCN